MRIILFVTAILFMVSSITTAQVTSYTAEDSLKPTSPLQCVSTKEVSVENSAADVAMGALKCVQSGKYQMAAELILVVSAYSYFDTLRVTDKSAHAAMQALLAETFSEQSQKKMEKLFVEINALTPDSTRHIKICEELRESGPPTYYPTYMIAHGLAVFTGDDSEPLVENFDAEKAWAKSLSEFTNCAAI